MYAGQNKSAAAAGKATGRDGQMRLVAHGPWLRPARYAPRASMCLAVMATGFTACDDDPARATTAGYSVFLRASNVQKCTDTLIRRRSNGVSISELYLRSPVRFPGLFVNCPLGISMNLRGIEYLADSRSALIAQMCELNRLRNRLRNAEVRAMRTSRPRGAKRSCWRLRQTVQSLSSFSRSRRLP